MDVDAILATAFTLVLPHLTERQRRLLLGGIAKAIGHGGVTRVAELAGSSHPTVRRGLRELEQAQPPLPAWRTRGPGGGPKRLATADPELLAALDALVDPDTRGTRRARCAGRPSRPGSWHGP